jgi:hypothetical protein
MSIVLVPGGAFVILVAIFCCAALPHGRREGKRPSIRMTLALAPGFWAFPREFPLTDKILELVALLSTQFFLISSIYFTGLFLRRCSVMP